LVSPLAHPTVPPGQIYQLIILPDNNSEHTLQYSQLEEKNASKERRRRASVRFAETTSVAMSSWCPPP
jgi:hypothetical protein